MRKLILGITVFTGLLYSSSASSQTEKVYADDLINKGFKIVASVKGASTTIDRLYLQGLNSETGRQELWVCSIVLDKSHNCYRLKKKS